ncbi:hypothetical protein DUNSADRAFT_3753 [Dunaliella salina]|uniref:Uncharacterized protein n=1 Tax=Dunaliella salina TaxID=3046 RepID=A0ABQ7GTD9_DUNSA|nr:hypothetical protein DUNSADRAFT_3753 [Dunaliella salina]|eukprot:KAF5837860.1 hypothetical protein DUNSADRAFT_3753 [Dunaliella salina]
MQMRVQRERLEQRKTGVKLREADKRREQVKRSLSAKKQERQQERDLLAQGIMPDSLKDWKNYKTKRDERANSGVVVPLLPFGNQEYDEGERFDLRSPYADDGWVDPEEVDAFAGIKNFGKKFLNFGMRREEPGEQKPIIWASKYEQYVQERKQKEGERRK